MSIVPRWRNPALTSLLKHLKLVHWGASSIILIMSVSIMLLAPIQTPWIQSAVENVQSHIYPLFHLSFLNLHNAYVWESIIWVAKEKLRKHVLNSRSYNVDYWSQDLSPGFSPTTSKLEITNDLTL